MPERVIIEMVCDWRGAGKAQGHGNDLSDWYNSHKNKIILSPNTRIRVEDLVYQKGR
jgi:hypothetical protein